MQIFTIFRTFSRLFTVFHHFTKIKGHRAIVNPGFEFSKSKYRKIMDNTLIKKYIALTYLFNAIFHDFP